MLVEHCNPTRYSFQTFNSFQLFKLQLLLISSDFCRFCFTDSYVFLSFTILETSVCEEYFNRSGSEFSSPNFPNQYDNHERCEYRVESEAGEFVLLQFNSFDVEFEESCSYDVVKVPVNQFCGKFVLYVAYTENVQVTLTTFAWI